MNAPKVALTTIPVHPPISLPNHIVSKWAEHRISAMSATILSQLRDLVQSLNIFHPFKSPPWRAQLKSTITHLVAKFDLDLFGRKEIVARGLIRLEEQTSHISQTWNKSNKITNENLWAFPVCPISHLYTICKCRFLCYARHSHTNWKLSGKLNKIVLYCFKDKPWDAFINGCIIDKFY